MLVLLVLALIILVLVGFLITRSGSAYIKTTSCENIKGNCMKSSDCDGTISALPGCDKDQICCLEEVG